METPTTHTHQYFKKAVIAIQEKSKQKSAQEREKLVGHAFHALLYLPEAAGKTKSLVKTTITCTFLILNYNRKINSFCDIYSYFQRYFNIFYMFC